MLHNTHSDNIRIPIPETIEMQQSDSRLSSVGSVMSSIPRASIASEMRQKREDLHFIDNFNNDKNIIQTKDDFVKKNSHKNNSNNKNSIEIIKKREINKQWQGDRAVYEALRRTTVCTYVAILSTFSMAVFGYFFGCLSMFIALDTIINS